MQSKHVRTYAYAEILTIQLLYLVELVTHTATTLKNHRPALCCAHNMTFRSVLCRACPSSGCRTNVSGYWQWCSLRAAATWSHPIVPPAGPCFYLKQQQQILTCTSFLFDSKNDKLNYFLLGKTLQGLRRLKYWVTFTWTGSAQDAAYCLEAQLTVLGLPASEDYLCYLFFLYSVNCNKW